MMPFGFRLFKREGLLRKVFHRLSLIKRQAHTLNSHNPTWKFSTHEQKESG